MQNLDHTFSRTLEVIDFPEAEPDDTQVVVFELLVPGAAKVPAPRQPAEVATMRMREASVTTTVPGKILTQLRANNTAQGLAWCITATLAAAPRLRSACHR